jgi:hypothetical protein
MPRLAGLDAPGILHHVMGRGIERKKNLRLSGQRINIAALAQLASKKYNISPGELRSGSSKRDVTIARGSIFRCDQLLCDSICRIRAKA